MNLKKYIYIAISLVMGAYAISASASPKVTAKLDSATLQMGRMTTLRVSIDQKENERGRFPIFSQLRENGIIPVCGDSVELRMPLKIDTVKVEGGLKITMDVPVQSFDSGYYQLPRIEFVVGVDTFRSNSVALKVVPVTGVTADTPIADYANVADPENSSIFDSLPDWLYNYWWIILLGLLLIGAGTYAYLRYKKNGSILPKKPEPTPYEVAITALNKLKEQKLWEQGMDKEYYTSLTDILRSYLEARFGINAKEMTTRQILSSLSENEETKEKRGMLRQLLSISDFVKFAKVRPLPADNISSYDAVKQFVESTKPVVAETIDVSAPNVEDKRADEKTEKEGGER